MDNTQADITADLTEEQIWKTAASAKGDPFRAVAAMARKGWRPIPKDEGFPMTLHQPRSNPCRLVVPAAEGAAQQLVEQLHELASERPWEQEGWCNELGRCWMGNPGHDEFIPSWRLCRPEDAPHMIWSLPHWAISVPTLGDAS